MRGCIEGAGTLRRVPSRSILSEAESDRVRVFLRKRLAKEHGGNVASLAREMGVTQPRLSRTLNERHGVSLDTAKAVAEIEGIGLMSVLRDPRELAAELAREVGMAEGAVQRVLGEPEDDPPRPALHYVERMRLFEALEGMPAPGTPPSTVRSARRTG